jgi:hypothetical protein
MLAKQAGLTINAYIRKTLEEKAESELVIWLPVLDCQFMI